MSGGGSSQPANTTTTQNPPDYVVPYLRGAANESAALYSKGPKQYYSGNTVTPQSQQTQQALQLTQQRALNGSPINTSASNYTADVLNGKYLNSNPYLDATFNKAAQGTQSQLASQFAGSGRNIGASYAARADQLNNLATDIYGGNYQNERGIQQQTLGMAPTIANQDYFDYGQLANVGAQNEDLASRQIADKVARWDYSQNAPGISLDQYIARLNNQPGGTATTTTPVFSNRVAGGLGGAALGAGIGQQFGYGGIGAGIGGLLGAYGG